MHDQVNRSAPADIGFVVEPPAARNNDVMPLGLRAERRAFRLGLKAVMLQNITKWNVADLVCEFGDFHRLMGHPNERRSSLNVLVTSSGEGQSDNAFVAPNSSFLGALGFGGGSSGVNPRAAWWAASSP